MKAAQDCLKRKHFNATANRAYYAMYHAAIAALNQSGYGSGRVGGRWQHGTVRRAFNLRLGPAGSGMFPGRYYRYLDDGYVMRLKADYQPAGIKSDEATRIAMWCADMVQLVKENL